MEAAARRILRALEKEGELPLDEALRLASPRHGNHIDQYPLALLIEEGYAGWTINYEPPNGAEKMREFALAITFHMFTLPKDKRGDVKYLSVTSSGSIDPKNERVFIKAKGALHVDAERAKRRERWITYAVGFGSGLMVAILAAWLRTEFGLK